MYCSLRRKDRKQCLLQSKQQLLADRRGLLLFRTSFPFNQTLFIFFNTFYARFCDLDFHDFFCNTNASNFQFAFLSQQPSLTHIHARRSNIFFNASFYFYRSTTRRSFLLRSVSPVTSFLAILIFSYSSLSNLILKEYKTIQCISLIPLLIQLYLSY